MNDQKRLIYSLFFPVFLIIAIWGVKLIEVSSDLSFVEWGIYPKEWYGLKGILFSPFIHADFKHLFNNSVPLFIVSYLLIYFYKEVSYKAFFLIWIITGIWVWFGARESFHIGASGVVYGIISFVFFSGIIRLSLIHI